MFGMGFTVVHLVGLLLILVVLAAVVGGVVWLVLRSSRPGQSSGVWTPEQRGTDRQV